MNSKIPVLATLAATLTLTSCQTTGDPNAGGYFGWSQKKATVRQNDLRNELDFRNSESQNLKSKQDSLIAQRNSLRSQIAKAKKEVAAAQTPETKAAATNRLGQLNRELVLLESTM